MLINCRARIYTAIMAVLVMIVSPVFAGDKDDKGNKAASVNGTVITMEVFTREMLQFQQRLASQGKKLSDSQMSGIKKDMLENLINRELLYQESERHNITIQESAITKQIDGLKKRFPSEAEYNNWLQKMNFSEEEIKSRFKKEIKLKQFVDIQFSQKISVSSKETKAYYDNNPNFFKQSEKVRASHILIKVDPEATAARKSEAREQLEGIQKKLKNGEDFGEMAKAYSQGPSSAQNGDLGYFGRGQMVKPFEEVAFALKPGEVSDIVETNFGYHLIKVVDKKPEAKVDYKEARNRIEQYLKQDKIRKEISQLIEKLKQNAVVERYL